MNLESVKTQPVMTFAEIAAVIGVSKQRAEQLYWSAVRKLRKHPRACQTMLAMQVEIDARRQMADRVGHVKTWRAN